MTGARQTSAQRGDQEHAAQQLSMQIELYAQQQSLETATLAHSPRLSPLMNPERPWGSPSAQVEALLELKRSLLSSDRAQLTKDIMLLTPRLSQLCEGERCRYEPLVPWSEGGREEGQTTEASIEALSLKPLGLNDTLAPRWAWVGPTQRLSVAVSVSGERTYGLFVSMGLAYKTSLSMSLRNVSSLLRATLFFWVVKS